MDREEAKLFRGAHYRLAFTLAQQGDMERAGRLIADLLELDPADRMDAVGMGRTLGVFPECAAGVASRVTT